MSSETATPPPVHDSPVMVSSTGGAILPGDRWLSQLAVVAQLPVWATMLSAFIHFECSGIQASICF